MWLRYICNICKHNSWDNEHKVPGWDGKYKLEKTEKAKLSPNLTSLTSNISLWNRTYAGTALVWNVSALQLVLPFFLLWVKAYWLFKIKMVGLFDVGEQRNVSRVGTKIYLHTLIQYVVPISSYCVSSWKVKCTYIY